MLLHAPAAIDETSPVVVAVHGISRNSAEHFDAFRRALPANAVLLCPEFGEAEFPHYQRLNIGYAEPRADLLLDLLLDRLSSRFRIDARRFHLFGFSGGGQFAHRYAMLNPHRIQSLHVAAAGYYTFLNEAAPWPYGCRGPTGRGILERQRLFLRLPIDVYVGNRDVQRDPSLRTGERIDAQQGPTRVDRARNWVAHLNRCKPAGAPEARLTLLNGAGHDFMEAARCDKGVMMMAIGSEVARATR